MKVASGFVLCVALLIGVQGCCSVPMQPQIKAVTPVSPTGHTPPVVAPASQPPAATASNGSFNAQERQAAAVLYGSDIYFYFNSAALTDSARAVLNQKAQILKEYPRLRVVLEGHCDERGTDQYNMNLGARRAKAALEYLASLGVSQKQLEMVSFGKSHPAVTGQGEEVWSQNRRVAFDVSLVGD